MRRVYSLLLPLLILLVGIGCWFSQSGSQSAGTGKLIQAASLDSVRDAELAELLKGHHGSREISPSNLAHAVELAKSRGERMKQWIVADPEQALAQSISFAEYEALPEELKPWFERPFAEIANLRIMPVCAEGAGREPMRILEMDGKSWDASVYGWRNQQVTKENTPLVGISLGGLAAISENAFVAVATDEADALTGVPLGNEDAQRDFSNGRLLGRRAVTALAGGKRYLFEDQASLNETNRRMAELDSSLSPKAGSNLVFAPSPGQGGAIDWGGLEEEVELQASAWSETPKSVFCIRVDFSDVEGEVVSQSALANVMNVPVASSITEMSYGKTTVSAEVSATTVRMPEPASYYVPSNNSGLHTDAKDAYELIAGDGVLDNYDIVVVHFAGIGMQGGGLTYAGLAGGGNQWLQGTTSSGVIIHEFGHNYGIGHSGFWDTSDGSVVGAGSNVEYGDQTDIMGSGPDPEGHFHMQAKQKLGWLEAGQWDDAAVSGSGVRRIYRFDSDDTTGALRGVRVPKGVEGGEYYWVGYRPGISTYPAFQQGAYLLWQRPGNSRSWLIDTTPGTEDGKLDAPVAIGRTYTDSVTDVHVTTLGKGGSGADQWLDVNVQIGPFPDNAPPTATITGSSAVGAREELTFSASAADEDGDELAYFWDFGDGSTGPNAASATHRWLVGGSYTVTLSVSDMKGGSVEVTQVVNVSDPLDTWTAGTVGASRSVNRSAYLNGRFVVTGNQYAYTSFDGLAWSEQYLALNFRSGGMAYGNGEYLIAGYDSVDGSWVAVVFTSPDGLQWERVELATFPELRDVAYGTGAFVAVGDDGTILRSVDDGQTWAAMSAPGTTSLRSIAFSGSEFVAVGGTAIYTSPDGEVWTDRSGGHSLPSWQSFDSVTYANGMFIAGGWYSGVHVSQDGGVTWGEVPIRGGHDYEIQDIVAGDGCIIAAAVDQDDGDTPAILVSYDGTSWQESSYDSFPNTDAIAFGNGRFFTADGSSGETLSSDAFYPANGAPLAEIDAPAAADARSSVLFSSIVSDPDNDPVTVEWDFKDGSPLVSGTAAVHTFSVGGSYSVDLIATDTRGGVTVTNHLVMVADPLDSWVTRTSGTTAHLNDIVAGGGLLVAVGENGGTYRTSSDGITWGGGGIGINIYLRAVTYDGANFVAVGQDYDFGASAWTGAIYTSPDGGSWTRRHFSGPPLRGVTYGLTSGGGLGVAVGDDGTIWYSSDRISWLPAPSSVADHLRDVAFGDGTFVICGSAGTVQTSADGSSWTDTTGGSGLASWQGFSEMEFADGLFFAGGWYARLRNSSDLGATFSTTESGYRNISGYAFGNGVHLAVGIDKDNDDADINLISQDGVNWSPLTTEGQDDRQSVVFFEDTFITVGSNGTIRQSAVFSASSVTGYAAWQMDHFPGSPLLSGSDEDFDGDGVANLIEYLTGSDPRDGSDWVSMTSEIEGNLLVLTIPRDPAANDLIVTALKSTALDDWSTIGVTILENSGTQFRAAIPLSEAKGFLRAEVEVE